MKSIQIANQICKRRENLSVNFEEKLGIKRNKTRTTLVTLVLILSMTFTLVALPSVNAHTPPWSVPTYCYVAPTPDVIGVNQQMLIVWWLNALPPTASGAYGDRWIAYVDITRPDGTKETKGPLTSDPVGGSFFVYTPNQVGKYAIVARFPGQTITGYPTPGGARPTDVSVNDTYMPSTSVAEYFTVQQQSVPSYIETPLPKSYWTRPVYDANKDWGNEVMGQWLGGASYESLRVLGVPFTQGPESSHILWTRSYWSGGIMGGFGDAGYYNGVAYEGFGSPELVLEGKAYYPVQTPPRYGWYCIDLYSGETLYYENNTDGTLAMPSFGEVLDIENPNQHGGFPYLWRTSGLGTNVWEMLDGFSGNGICKIANVSASGTQFRDSMGSICYVNLVNQGTATAPNYYMQIWNTTDAIWWRSEYGTYEGKTLFNGSTSLPNSATNNYWFWRPGATTVGMSTGGYTTYDGRNGYSLNVSIATPFGPRNPVLNQTGTIQAVRTDQFVIVGAGGQNDARGTVNGFLRTYSLKQGEYGKVLSDIVFTPPKASDDFPNSTYSGGISFGGVSPEAGVFTFTERVTGKIWVYSLTTGKQLWAYQIEDPWYYYGTSITIHGGKAYIISSTGVLRAFNATTGQQIWTWSAPSIGYLEVEGYTQTPLTLSFFVDEPAHEKVYVMGSSGAAGLATPIERDSAMFCIDTNTGKMLWRLMAWPSRANNALSREIISEGRIMYLDNHDNQIYCIGRGSSATSVTVQQNVIAQGSSVMVTGTVTDNTPSGRHKITGSLDFTLKGTPAISDSSMDNWMEYMYHQHSKPTNATGVPVKLTAIDPNGNYQVIGTVTSDMEGNYGFMWTPAVPGTYKVTATFDGSASYGPSDATTYFGVTKVAASPTVVTPAPTQTQTAVPTPITPTPTAPSTPSPVVIPPTSEVPTATYIAIGAAVIIIIAAATSLILRKRK
jgi:hypothetical protein